MNTVMNTSRSLALIVVITLSCCSHLISFSNAFSASSIPKNKQLPEAELINRRKSPALWRDDLNSQFQINVETSVKNVNPLRRLPKYPPEVMSPCGGFPQLRAAIANGADSVYLGLSAFSARARASNFSPSELQKAVTMAHSSGVKVYVALNVLVFQNELAEVAGWIKICERAGVDAIIVQDVGVTRLAREIAPNLEIHASTQQTVTSTDGVLYAKERGGANRVVLGRELSVDEISSVTNDLYAFKDETGEDIEIEAFVHGALCVSYSGQCFSSEAWGGRSANRGQCAQACRLPYGLIRNGELEDLQDMTYLLSPQDLCGLEQVEDLVRAGVSCLKIEGRLKDEKYVAATTRAYRNAVNAAWEKIMKENEDVGTIDSNEVKSHRNRILESFETITKAELAQLFARGQDELNDGLTPGFFEGSQHQRLVRGRNPRHRGVHVGRVAHGSSSRNGLVISIDNNNSSKPLSSILKLGDGIVIDRGLPQEEELGGPIFSIEEKANDGDVVVKFGKNVERQWRKTDDASNRGIGSRAPLAQVGAHVWKTRDATVDKKMKRLIEAATPRGSVKVVVSGDIGSSLKVEIIDLTTGRVGIGQSDGVLSEAEQGGLQESSVLKAIGTMGNTKWKLIGGDNSVDLALLQSGSWCPVSWVKKARQRAVEHLIQLDNEVEDEIALNQEDLEHSHDIGHAQSDVVKRLVEDTIISLEGDQKESSTTLSVLARNQEQIQALCEIIDHNENSINEVIVDFLEVDGMRDAVAKLRESNTKVVIAAPRIIKPGEEEIWRTLLRLKPDGLLIRSAGLIHRLQTLGGTGASIDVGDGHLVAIPELIGDFSLNAVNTLTAGELLNYGGLSRITAAYDLSANAITELARCMNKDGSSVQLEVVAHAHLPIFHTEHCVFARFLSNGNSYLDCGHVCTRNTVHLRDQSGKDNLVLADMGCRNTVFSAEAQSGVHSLQEWATAGVGCIRIELVDEGKEDVKKIVDGYRGVLSGEERASEVWEILKTVCDSNGRTAGVSHGSFRNIVERRAGEL